MQHIYIYTNGLDKCRQHKVITHKTVEHGGEILGVFDFVTQKMFCHFL